MSPPDLGSRPEGGRVLPRIEGLAAFPGRRRAHGRPRAFSPSTVERGDRPPQARISAIRGLGAHGRPASAQCPRSGVGRRCVTPRQTCPRPDGFGRNLRSKTRWFTGFCNSHQVSHFATFFIDARAEISVAESRYVIVPTSGRSPGGLRLRSPGARPFVRVPWRVRRRVWSVSRAGRRLAPPPTRARACV